MHYNKAKKISDRLIEIFTPHCDKIDVVGSIRREKSDVHDIEFCCIPKEEFIQTDLLGGGNWMRIKAFTEAINLISDTVVKGKTDGKMMQIKMKGGMTLDLFMPDPDDYYRQLAIRTGSAEYSANVIAHTWREKGWCGTFNAGLRKMSDCIETKSGWKCLNLTGEKPPVWQSEQSFFRWLDLPYLEPRLRY